MRKSTAKSSCCSAFVHAALRDFVGDELRLLPVVAHLDDAHLRAVARGAPELLRTAARVVFDEAHSRCSGSRSSSGNSAPASPPSGSGSAPRTRGCCSPPRRASRRSIDRRRPPRATFVRARRARFERARARAAAGSCPGTRRPSDTETAAATSRAPPRARSSSFTVSSSRSSKSTAFSVFSSAW